MPEKPVVFISCGQCTSDEIALENEVERFIREQTPYEPYFAEQQNTLDGLVTNGFPVFTVPYVVTNANWPGWLLVS